VASMAVVVCGGGAVTVVSVMATCRCLAILLFVDHFCRFFQADLIGPRPAAPAATAATIGARSFVQVVAVSSFAAFGAGALGGQQWVAAADQAARRGVAGGWVISAKKSWVIEQVSSAAARLSAGQGGDGRGRAARSARPIPPKLAQARRCAPGGDHGRDPRPSPCFPRPKVSFTVGDRVGGTRSGRQLFAGKTPAPRSDEPSGGR